MQGITNEYLLVSLSFNSYSTNGLAAIASKVTDELKNIHENDEEDFEFSVEFSNEFDLTADEEFTSVFPIFNRDLLLQSSGDNVDSVIRRNVSIKIPLDDIFIEDCEEEHSENSSNSEADESEPSAVRTAYCLWRPKFVVEASPETWKKSKSTGQGTRRWKLRDLLRRSNSDGKGFPFVFPIAKQVEEKIVRSKKGGDLTENGRNRVDGERRVKTGEVSPARSPLHEVFYLRNRVEKEGGKRKSYLPYRQNIFAFFSGFNKSFN